MHVALLSLVLVWLLGSPMAWAGSPHFVSCAQSVSGSTLTVDGKEAGLGDELSVHIVVSATASCINPGGNHPKAENKQSVSGGGDFPVTNGKALFSVDVPATFSPECSPPMAVTFTDVTACDVANNVCCSL